MLAKMEWRMKKILHSRSFIGGVFARRIPICCGPGCMSPVSGTRGDQDSVWESHKGDMGDSEILAYAYLCMVKIDDMIPKSFVAFFRYCLESI